MSGIFDGGKMDPMDLAMLLAISEELSEEEKLLADAEPTVTDGFEDDDDREDSDESMPERDDDNF